MAALVRRRSGHGRAGGGVRGRRSMAVMMVTEEIDRGPLAAWHVPDWQETGSPQPKDLCAATVRFARYAVLSRSLSRPRASHPRAGDLSPALAPSLRPTLPSPSRPYVLARLTLRRNPPPTPPLPRAICIGAIHPLPLSFNP